MRKMIGGRGRGSGPGFATTTISHPALRHMLLFRAHDLSEFDESFKRKQRLNKDKGSVLMAAFKALNAPLFDSDIIRNLRILENLEKRIMEGRTQNLEDVMLAFAATEAEIDDMAYQLYGVADHRQEIEAELKIVL
ncbi:MAG: hypothetical protein R2865_07415 [Deinococcales bacterium]